MQYKEKDWQWYAQINDDNGHLTRKEINFNPLPKYEEEEEEILSNRINFNNPIVQMWILILAWMLTSLLTMVWYRPAPEVQITLSIQELNLWTDQNLENAIGQKATILKEQLWENIKKLDMNQPWQPGKDQDTLIHKK